MLVNVEPEGGNLTYWIDVPADHTPGLSWLHPHVRGREGGGGAGYTANSASTLLASVP